MLNNYKSPLPMCLNLLHRTQSRCKITLNEIFVKTHYKVIFLHKPYRSRFGQTAKYSCLFGRVIFTVGLYLWWCVIEITINSYYT